MIALCFRYADVNMCSSSCIWRRPPGESKWHAFEMGLKNGRSYVNALSTKSFALPSTPLSFREKVRTYEHV